MAETPVHTLIDVNVAYPENRYPSVEELLPLLEHNDYLVTERDPSGKNRSFFLKEPYNPIAGCDITLDISFSDNGTIDLYSLGQASLQQALDVARIICKQFGPYYLGVNGFNEIFLLDETAGIEKMNSVLEPVQSGDDNFLEWVRTTGMKESPATDPGPAVPNRFTRALQLICDSLEEMFAKHGYVRKGSTFYRGEEKRILAIHPVGAYYTSEKTAFLSARFDLLNREPYEALGITVPDFPAPVYFHQSLLYPRKKEFVAWGYKQVEASQITDMDWLASQKDYLVSLAERFPALAEEYFPHA